MEPSLSELHPNPGWRDSCKSNDIEILHTSCGENISRHCILELYQCDHAKLNDEAFIRTTITTSAKIAGATLINLVTHSFKPQGVTGLALLAESHISIHTWPEIGYAAIDVFTCGDHTMPEKACKLLFKDFLAQHFSFRNIQREIPPGIQALHREL
ncbi:adenosylmethionine decarboxylase [Prochlorococcus sp. MIT 0916]|uniref:S-adenosylmethionine decarboxylase proenzyme n=1 Tax=Prochlorococcus marinus str. P0903-H212 TaxID=1622208 RepID=A0A0D5A3L0_PROMR|nr:S-adenosylmethionine decarboxylase proenzyme [Prochlorococcus marinus str. P0903-H212]